MDTVFSHVKIPKVCLNLLDFAESSAEHMVYVISTVRQELQMCVHKKLINTTHQYNTLFVVT